MTKNQEKWFYRLMIILLIKHAIVWTYLMIAQPKFIGTDNGVTFFHLSIISAWLCVGFLTYRLLNLVTTFWKWRKYVPISEVIHMLKNGCSVEEILLHISDVQKGLLATAKQRRELENRAIELGISFEDNISNELLTDQIEEAEETFRMWEKHVLERCEIVLEVHEIPWIRALYDERPRRNFQGLVRTILQTARLLDQANQVENDLHSTAFFEALDNQELRKAEGLLEAAEACAKARREAEREAEEKQRLIDNKNVDEEKLQLRIAKLSEKVQDNQLDEIRRQFEAFKALKPGRRARKARYALEQAIGALENQENNS